MSDKVEVPYGSVYEGKECVKCGSTLRYARSKRCVPCQCKAKREAHKKDYEERNRLNINKYHSDRKENYTDISWRINIAYRNSRQRSIKRGSPFNITKEYLEELYETQGGKCAVSGRIFVLDMSDEFKTHPDAPSLDKVNPSLGYTKGNVRFVTYQVNSALNQFGESKLLELCKSILENNNE